MKRIVIPALLLLVASGLFADFAQTIVRADELYDQEDLPQTISLLENLENSNLSTLEETSLYWRLARAYHAKASRLRDDDAAVNRILADYETGEEYADKGIEAVENGPRNNPEAFRVYFWHSACIGSWGQVKGILDSLFKAAPMREDLEACLEQKEDFADAFHVLGMLYEALPGGFISFGDKNKAVSFGRAAVDFMQNNIDEGIRERIDYEFYIELSSHLYLRNWDQRRRDREQAGKLRTYNRSNDVLDKFSNYEGTVDLSSQSDREEATELLNWSIRNLQRIDREPHDDRMLEKAIELRDSWN